VLGIFSVRGAEVISEGLRQRVMGRGSAVLHTKGHKKNKRTGIALEADFCSSASFASHFLISTVYRVRRDLKARSLLLFSTGKRAILGRDARVQTGDLGPSTQRAARWEDKRGFSSGSR
jgi:hypothetical protein